MGVCEWIVKDYLGFLERAFYLEENKECCLIHSPFLTPHSDNMAVEVRRLEGRGLELSDRGSVSDYLFLAGAPLDTSETRMEQATEIAKSLQVSLEHGEIVVTVEDGDAGNGLFRLLSAMQAIYDISMTAAAEPLMAPFRDTVHYAFQEHKIIHDFEYKVWGKSLQHTIDFRVNGRRNAYIDAISATNRGYAKRVAIETTWKWIDLREYQDGFVPYIIFDDNYDVWSETTLAILRNYSEDVIPWTRTGHEFLRSLVGLMGS